MCVCVCMCCRVLPQGAEMPIVNPVVTGKPYSHCYMVCSPIKGGTYWGPNQVRFDTHTHTHAHAHTHTRTAYVSQTSWCLRALQCTPTRNVRRAHTDYTSYTLL